MPTAPSGLDIHTIDDDEFAVSAEGRPAGRIRFERHGGDLAIASLEPLTGNIDERWAFALGQAARIVAENWRSALLVHWPTSLPFGVLTLREGGFGRIADITLARPGTVALLRPARLSIPHNRLSFGSEEVAAAAAAVATGWWVAGPEAALLEADLTAVAGRRHATAVGTGLGALRLALRGLGTGPGDEVIVPAYSCVALPNAVTSLGAIPIPADIGDDHNIAADVAANLVSRRTRAIIAVHTFGTPADIGSLRRLEVPVVEDCSHGIGPIEGGLRLGSLGDVAAVSMHATKLFGGGEGGAVLSDSPSIDAIIRDLRDYADKDVDGGRFNDMIGDVEAAVARVQLSRLPEFCRRRAELADRYSRALATTRLGLPGLVQPRIWYRYAVSLPERMEAVRDHMATLGVTCHRPIEDWRHGTGAPAPRADEAYRTLLSLPLYPSLRDDEQDRVVDALLSSLETIR